MAIRAVDRKRQSHLIPEFHKAKRLCCAVLDNAAFTRFVSMLLRAYDLGGMRVQGWDKRSRRGRLLTRDLSVLLIAAATWWSGALKSASSGPDGTLVPVVGMQNSNSGMAIRIGGKADLSKTPAGVGGRLKPWPFKAAKVLMRVRMGQLSKTPAGRESAGVRADR